MTQSEGDTSALSSRSSDLYMNFIEVSNEQFLTTLKVSKLKKLLDLLGKHQYERFAVTIKL